MTDQFSQEYIAFILSDEAKGLQEKWEPKVGDWIKEPPYAEPTLVGDHRMLAQFEGMNFRTWAVWLPTLWDLLRIIEGAGYSWEHTSMGFWRLHLRPIMPRLFVFEAPYTADDMLAVARLAVRAIGGKNVG